MLTATNKEEALMLTIPETALAMAKKMQDRWGPNKGSNRKQEGRVGHTLNCGLLPL
jgi:hypothetical protein